MLNDKWRNISNDGGFFYETFKVSLNFLLLAPSHERTTACTQILIASSYGPFLTNLDLFVSAYLLHKKMKWGF